MFRLVTNFWYVQLKLERKVKGNVIFDMNFGNRLEIRVVCSIGILINYAKRSPSQENQKKYNATIFEICRQCIRNAEVLRH